MLFARKLSMKSSMVVPSYPTVNNSRRILLIPIRSCNISDYITFFDILFRNLHSLLLFLQKAHRRQF